MWCWIKSKRTCSVMFRYCGCKCRRKTAHFTVHVLLFFRAWLGFLLTSKRVKQQRRKVVREALDTSTMFKSLIKFSQYLKFTFILLGKLFSI
jgi:hypothetical protein